LYIYIFVKCIGEIVVKHISTKLNVYTRLHCSTQLKQERNVWVCMPILMLNYVLQQINHWSINEGKQVGNIWSVNISQPV